MILSYIFDALIVLLLGVAIGYAYVLNQRLRVLRDSRGELERVVNSLAEAISQADSGLNEIHNVANSLGRDLDRKIDSARGHGGEIEALIERAELAASRLETAISVARRHEDAGAQAFQDEVVERLPLDRKPKPVAEPAPAPKPRSKARPTPAKLFVGLAEEEAEEPARAAGGSIVKALRGMR